MAVSLGFHIIFASLGVGLPLMLLITEYRANRTGDAVWMALTRRWAKALGIGDGLIAYFPEPSFSCSGIHRSRLAVRPIHQGHQDPTLSRAGTVSHAGPGRWCHRA